MTTPQIEHRVERRRQDRMLQRLSLPAATSAEESWRGVLYAGLALAAFAAVAFGLGWVRL